MRLGRAIAPLTMGLMALALAVAYALSRAGASFGSVAVHPNVVSGAPPWVGALTILVGMVWCAAGAVALTGSVLVDGGDPARARLLRDLGLLTVLLGIDTAFLLHNVVLPAVGVPKLLVVLAYAALAAWILVRDAKVLRASASSWALLLGAALFGAWTLIAAVEPPGEAWSASLTALKVIGSGAWSGGLAAMVLVGPHGKGGARDARL